MYRIKRFSSKKPKKVKELSRSEKALGAGVNIASTAYLGNIIGSEIARDKFNKNLKKAADRVTEGVKSGKYSAEDLRKLSHPDTISNFKKIGNMKVKKGGFKGAAIGATVGLGMSVNAIRLHNKKVNKYKKDLEDYNNSKKSN